MTEAAEQEIPKESGLTYKLLIKPTQVANISVGGIILTPNSMEAERAQAANNIGIVLAIGETAFHHERYGYGEDWFKVPVKVGDKVRFKPHSVHLFQYKDESGIPTGDYYQIVNDGDILSKTVGEYE